jgi:hypothetical protein
MSILGKHSDKLISLQGDRCFECWWLGCGRWQRIF